MDWAGKWAEIGKFLGDFQMKAATTVKKLPLFNQLSKLAEAPPPLTEQSLINVRKKQGAGMWQADIGE